VAKLRASVRFYDPDDKPKRGREPDPIRQIGLFVLLMLGLWLLYQLTKAH